MIVYAVYTALVLAALAALFTSTAPYAAPWTLAGAAVLSAFILGYVQYAEKEWAKWPATAWTPLAALLYFMLFSSLVVNFAVQIAVAAAVITVAALTRGVTLWGPGGPIRSVIRAGRIAPWGLLVGSPLVLFVAGYELYRMYRQAPLAVVAAVATYYASVQISVKTYVVNVTTIPFNATISHWVDGVNVTASGTCNVYIEVRFVNRSWTYVPYVGQYTCPQYFSISPPSWIVVLYKDPTVIINVT